MLKVTCSNNVIKLNVHEIQNVGAKLQNIIKRAQLLSNKTWQTFLYSGQFFSKIGRTGRMSIYNHNKRAFIIFLKHS